MDVPGGDSALPGIGEDGPAQGRVPFRLRIGVTGHRKLPEGDELSKAVKRAINLAISSSGYRKSGMPNTPLQLTVVSALAEGADRLVAKEVLALNGSRLVCVLPVCEKDLGLYYADFEMDGSRQEFDDLRKQAWRQIWAPRELVPPDATKEQREAGYLWAGQEVVRNSDVVIAIWDGEPSRGTGGTADLIRWMQNRDKDRSRSGAAPAIYTRPARKVLTSALFGPPGADEAVFDSPGPLRIIVLTTGDHGPFLDGDPSWDAAVAAAKERLGGELAGLEEFNHKDFKAAWDLRVEQTQDSLASARYRQCSRLNGILNQIAPPLARADQAAMTAQRAFRWSSYALFGCTALATIVAAAQAVIFTGTWELTIGELALIIASIVIVGAENRWKNNNKHWFVYRFLAERLRSACYLLAVGCDPEVDFDVGGTVEEPTRNDWVRRAFTAVIAEGGAVTEPTPEETVALSSLIRVEWVGGQVGYFDKTSKKMMRKHHAVLRLLYGVLGATIIAALLHSLRLWPFHSGNTQALVMCAIGLPAVAAALSNIRSIREFTRHSFRYRRMAAVLRGRLEAFDDESGIEGLRKLAAEVSDLLTDETRGWLVEVSGRGLEIHG
jgi:hypothetical protein